MQSAGVRIDPFGFFGDIGDLELDCTANLDAMDYRSEKLGREVTADEVKAASQSSAVTL